MKIIIVNNCAAHLCNLFPFKFCVLWFIYPRPIWYLNWRVCVCMYHMYVNLCKNVCVYACTYACLCVECGVLVSDKRRKGRSLRPVWKSLTVFTLCPVVKRQQWNFFKIVMYQTTISSVTGVWREWQCWIINTIEKETASWERIWAMYIRDNSS